MTTQKEVTADSLEEESKEELIEELQTMVRTVCKALEDSLIRERTMRETLTLAQESGTRLATENQMLKARLARFGH